MAKIVFSYNEKEVKIKCRPEEKVKELLEIYKQIKIKYILCIMKKK